MGDEQYQLMLLSLLMMVVMMLVVVVAHRHWQGGLGPGHQAHCRVQATQCWWARSCSARHHTPPACLVRFEDCRRLLLLPKKTRVTLARSIQHTSALASFSPICVACTIDVSSYKPEH